MSLEIRKAEAAVAAILEERNPLAVALEASKPLATDPVPLAVERLLDSYARRTAPDPPVEELAETHGPARRRNSKEISRVLSILDELETRKDARA